MKTMLIGAPISFGENIVKRFSADTFSTRSGYNINQEDSRNTIAELSLAYDTVIVHSYTRQQGQLLTLQKVVDAWTNNSKVGNIIVTGSIVSYFTNYGKSSNGWEYLAHKSALDAYCKNVSKRCVLGDLTFKLTIIKPGMLDTENSRKKPHFVKGLNGEIFCDLVEFIISMPSDVIIPEIPIESIYD
jgi:NADP-dependent 3-hydroxy acid dehydrogenase YdfG